MPPRAAVGQFVLLFLALIVVAVIAQWLTGVYRSDLSQWPDEGAHYINGLLVHDYVIEGLPGSPLSTELAIYEVGISYYGRTYDEGKKINWVDGLQGAGMSPEI